MPKYEEMQYEFFSRLKSCGTESHPFKPYNLGEEFKIEPTYVREKLIQWADDEIISLYVCSRPYTDWNREDRFHEFFEDGNKDGYVRAKLLAAGDEWLERQKEIKQRPIGFRANPV